MFDYSYLLQKINENYDTLIQFSQACDISEQHLAKVLSNNDTFSISDITKISEVLELSTLEVNQFLFSLA